MKPERRLELILARQLGRTRGELRWGSAAFRPLTHQEWVEWIALYDLEAKEVEAQQRKAAKPKRSRQGDDPLPRTIQRARTEGDG